MNITWPTRNKQSTISTPEQMSDVNDQLDRLFQDMARQKSAIEAYDIDLANDVDATTSLALARLAGIDPLINTSFLRQDGTWAAPPTSSGFIQQVSAVRPQWSFGSPDGWEDVGWSTSSSGGADQTDSSGAWKRWTSGASDGSSANLKGTTFSGTWADWNPTLVFRVKTGSVITNIRLWFGFWSSAPTNNDDVGASTANKAVAFRYSTGAADPGWVGFKIDNGATAITSLVAAIAASTVYTLRITISGGGTLATFGVTPLGGAEVTQTLALTAVTGLVWKPMFYIYSRNAATHFCDVGSMYQENTCGH